jgi:hypothetical protein
MDGNQLGGAKRPFKARVQAGPRLRGIRRIFRSFSDFKILAKAWRLQHYFP